MGRQYFGTDGVRGLVGEPPLTVDFAMRLASAAARVLAPSGGMVMLGKDTRRSGYMFESALQAGFVAAGVDVKLVGPLPSPAVAFLTQDFGCDFGVVISASHNPYDDNGIKFFDRTGSKLDDAVELEIENALAAEPVTLHSDRLGTATRLEDARDRYVAFCTSTVWAGLNLAGLKIVVDGANGASYVVGPRTLRDLGANVVAIACEPDGANINEDCGATSPALLQKTVLAERADLGIAFDGDGDRVILVDHKGEIVDGDQILYVLAAARRERGEDFGPVVGTVMSNLGLEQALASQNVPFLRAQVGDRYVLEMLRQHGGLLGGETSGHVLCLDKATTGDALVAALLVLDVMQVSGKSLAELAAPVQKYPQVLKNVRLQRPFDLHSSPLVQAAVSQAEQRLGPEGRIVLRPSGTEPVIRVMVEGKDSDLVRILTGELAKSITAASTSTVSLG